MYAYNKRYYQVLHQYYDISSQEEKKFNFQQKNNLFNKYTHLYEHMTFLVTSTNKMVII